MVESRANWRKGMREPLFSITIPTFNRADLVKYAVRSIQAQTLQDFEIVISDNCSQDKTAAVAREFADPRVRYIRTPRHLVTVESFEYARRSARGRFVIVLNDDDALVRTALERFARECAAEEADFVFSKTAEYRDRGFPGPGRNTLESPPFLGASRRITAEEFIRPRFTWQSTFSSHPSAYVFARTLGEAVASRCGGLFQSNGVEYCAWPLAASFAERIVHVDAPLAVCGRTGKSWGSNMVLGSARKRRIKQFIDEYYVDPTRVPVKNFTMNNVMAEGILAAKELCPREFAQYELNEAAYARSMLRELRRRQALGVDVAEEFHELKGYLRVRHRDLLAILEDDERRLAAARRKNTWRRTRAFIGDLGIRSLRDRMRASRKVRARVRRDALKVRQGDVLTGFMVSGADFGFRDITGAADFLGGLVSRHQAPAQLVPA